MVFGQVYRARPDKKWRADFIIDRRLSKPYQVSIRKPRIRTPRPARLLFGKEAFFALARKSRGCAEAYTESTLCEVSPKIDAARGGKGPFPDGNKLLVVMPKQGATPQGRYGSLASFPPDVFKCVICSPGPISTGSHDLTHIRLANISRGKKTRHRSHKFLVGLEKTLGPGFHRYPNHPEVSAPADGHKDPAYRDKGCLPVI